jgi:hypothetical protein
MDAPEILCPEHGDLCGGVDCCCADKHRSVMDAPDLREMVARAINSADNEWADAPRTMPHEAWPQHVADAVLAVPAIADALRAAETLEKARVEFADTPNTRFLGAQVAAMLRDGGE